MALRPRTFALLALLCGALSAQTSRPQSAGLRGASWLPLEAGSYWEYADGGETAFVECAAAARQGDAEWFTLSAGPDRGIPSSDQWAVRTDGIYWRPGTFGRRGTRYEQAVRVLALPVGIAVKESRQLEAAPSDRPEAGAELPGLSFSAELEAIDEPTVTPAGTFSTARVTVCLEVDHCPKRRVTFWFARGVGVVRRFETMPGGFQSLMVLRRHVPRDAAPDTDLVAAAGRMLAADPQLTQRGAPSKIVPLRAAPLRHAFTSRFVRACWNDGSVLLREHKGTVTLFDPRLPEDWNRLLREDGGQLGSSSRLARDGLTGCWPVLLQEHAANGPKGLPRVSGVGSGANSGSVTVTLTGDARIKLTFASGDQGLRIERIETL